MLSVKLAEANTYPLVPPDVKNPNPPPLPPLSQSGCVVAPANILKLPVVAYILGSLP